MSSYASYLATKYPVVMITGPRQSGKTTLAKAVFGHLPYVNLEAPDHRRFALDDPRGFLSKYSHGAILDEIQRTPEILSYIQPLVDSTGKPGMFICTGSQQFELMANLSQSLAGRTGLLRLLPLGMEELAGAGLLPEDVDELLFRGFYPRVHANNIPPQQAHADYFATYVDRDLRQLLHVRDLSAFENFVRLCAARTGQLLNLQSLGADAGIVSSTVREWLSILESSYIVFRLQPWHTNMGKRLIKSPKLYFYDPGFAAWLCGVEDMRQVRSHPLRGAFFENMVVVDVVKDRWNRGFYQPVHFYRDSAGNEVDMLMPHGADPIPIEIKSGQTFFDESLRGLRAYERFKAARPEYSALIYGGIEAQERSGTSVVPWRQLHCWLNDIRGVEQRNQQ
jgi:predicted AAA+ superfamily ATPase